MRMMSAKTSRAYARKVIFPLAALVGILLLGAIAGIVSIAKYQTSVAIRQESTLAESAMHMMSDRLVSGAKDYGRWDEALAASVDKFDFAWLSKNIGEAAITSFGADYVFILDPDGKTVYSRFGDKDGKEPVETILPVDFDEWFAVWRRTPPYSELAKTIPLGKEAAVFAIAPLRPFEESNTRPPTGYSVVFVDVIDEPMLQRLRASFHLDDLQVLRPGAASPEGAAHVNIPAADGKTTLLLTWQPKRPGDDLMRIALPFLTFFVLALAILGAVVFRYVIQSAQVISDREKRAFRDALTGLANRPSFFHELDRAMERAERFGTDLYVMYADLDGFKAVNDTLGHAAGDELLIEAASRFQSCLRETDLVARLGGDEFAIIVTSSADKADVQAIASRMLLALAHPFELSAGIAEASCSIGIAECRGALEAAATVLDRADHALYEAKASGKNAMRFSSVPKKAELRAAA